VYGDTSDLAAGTWMGGARVIRSEPEPREESDSEREQARYGE